MTTKSKTNGFNYYQTIILVLAFIAIIINYLDRTSIAYAIIPLKQEFNLTNADFGFIAAAFGIGYMIMSFTGGILVDRFGPRKIWAYSAIIWSLIAAALGLSTSFIMLFILRVSLGIAEGPNFPALTKSHALAMPVNRRATGLAWNLTAVPLASAIGAPLITHLLIWFNWRIMFFILGALGVVWGIIWYLIYRDKPIDQQKPQPVSSKPDLKFLFTNPTLLVSYFTYFTYGYLLFFALGWLPGYIEITYDIHLKELGWLLSLPWLTATVMLLCGGFLSDWLWRKTKNLRICRSHVIWVCLLLSACFFSLLPFAHSIHTAIIFASLGLGFALMSNAPFYAMSIDLCEENAGSCLGLMVSFSAFAAIISPAITGILAEVSGDFNSGIYLVAALLLVSVVIMILFHHPEKKRVNEDSPSLASQLIGSKCD